MLIEQVPLRACSAMVAPCAQVIGLRPYFRPSNASATWPVCPSGWCRGSSNKRGLCPARGLPGFGRSSQSVQTTSSEWLVPHELLPCAPPAQVLAFAWGRWGQLRQQDSVDLCASTSKRVHVCNHTIPSMLHHRRPVAMPTRRRHQHPQRQPRTPPAQSHKLPCTLCASGPAGIVAPQ